MSGKRNFLKNLFTEEIPVESSVNKNINQQSPNNPPDISIILSGNKNVESSSPAYAASSEGKVDPKFLEMILARLERENLPGPDFIELFQSVQEMKKMNIPIDQAVTTSYIALKTGSKLTKKVIDESYVTYNTIFSSEKSEFEISVSKSISSKIEEPKKQIEALKLENTDIDRKIQEMQNKKIQNEQKIFELSADIQAKSAELEVKKKDYIFTLNYIMEQFEDVYKRTSNLS